MFDFVQELRLLGFLVVNGVVLWTAWWFAGRWTPSRSARLIDTLLLWYFVQYLAVGLPGLAHQLDTTAMYAVALALSAIMWFTGRWRRPAAVAPLPIADPSSRLDAWLVPVMSLFAMGFIAAYVWNHRYFPVVTTDAMIYHLPTAWHWLQSRGIVLFDAWYWSTAVTYSPAIGTAFTVWLLAPFQNDACARFVQVPALALVFVGMYHLIRALGASRSVAAVAAAAVVVSRPLSSQVLLQKDDLFVTAFFLAAVVACTPDRLRDRVAPWRFGIAVGMLAATKYTVALTLPVLLLLIDAPWRTGWRGARYAVALGCALVVGSPWYARNWWLTGNPLYPLDIVVGGHLVFEGQFNTDRNNALKSPAAIWDLLAGTYHSIPPLLLVPLLALMTAALALRVRGLMRDPLLRITLLGPTFGLLLFTFRAPLAGIRYIFPLYLLLVAAATVGSAAIMKRPTVQLAIAGALLIVSIATSLVWSNVESIALFSFVGLVTAGMGVAYIQLQRPFSRVRPAGPAIAAAAILLWCYVNWRAYLSDYRDNTQIVWNGVYADVAPAWQYVRDQAPPDAIIAAANAWTRYPLYGFAGDRRVVYAPMRPGVHHVRDLPRVPAGVNGDDVVHAIIASMNADADRQTWLANLRNSGATYLYISKREATADPPELRFAAADPTMFVRVAESAGAVVFRIDGLR